MCRYYMNFQADHNYFLQIRELLLYLIILGYDKFHKLQLLHSCHHNYYLCLPELIGFYLLYHLFLIVRSHYYRMCALHLYLIILLCVHSHKQLILPFRDNVMNFLFYICLTVYLLILVCRLLLTYHLFLIMQTLLFYY